jgi:Tol biopolymer transport system component
MNRLTPLLFSPAKYALVNAVLFFCLLISSCAPVTTPTVITRDGSWPSSVIPTVRSSPVTPAFISPTTTATVSPSVTSSPTSIFTLTATVTSRPLYPPLIVFTLLQDGKPVIHTIRPDGTGLAPLMTEEVSSYYQPQLSPDGHRIAFVSGETRETSKLTILDYENGQVQQVDFDGVTVFTWSPDRQRLAFTTEPETQGDDLDYYVYLVSLSDLVPVPLYKMPTTKRIVGLDWSPQGDKILAMWHSMSNPWVHLRLFSLSGEYTTIDDKGIWVFDASWDPTGEWIAFAGDKLPEWSYETWVISADGTQGHIIVQDEEVIDLGWSPDGKLMTYANGCCGNPSVISVIDLETNTVQQITPPEISAYLPSWSPDGAYLAFLAATEDIVTKGYSLNVYSFATGTVRQIVKEFVDDSKPVWRP